jgi:coenzyme F420-0:L-glutamate ligase/coenzyme F420-1:gamma-L-glutamate ligase
MAPISARALAGIRELRPGDDLAALIAQALGGAQLAPGALLAIAHTAVSKVEGAVVALAGVEPGERALELARELDKDPRVVQVVLEQSSEVVRAERGVIISRTPHGFVCANAGVDVSNTGGGGHVIVLPADPDSSARRLRGRLRELLAAAPAVLITDSFGRAWRNGQVDVAIGLAGLQPLDDWRGRTDARGTRLKATWLAVADAAAAAADLARRKDSCEPVVLIEGLGDYVSDEDGPGAAPLLRPREEDLFG